VYTGSLGREVASFSKAAAFMPRAIEAARQGQSVGTNRVRPERPLAEKHEKPGMHRGDIEWGDLESCCKYKRQETKDNHHRRLV
jgi:hypothetical protein